MTMLENQTPKYTMQTAFDTAVCGVIAQGCASANDATMQCLYRGPEGRKCAIGQLLTDAEAIESDELGLDVLRDTRLSLQGLSYAFLVSLQNAHDRAYLARNTVLGFVGQFRRRATEVAERHGLCAAAAAK